ncbi:MAG: MYXO-CTERM sorting domain-containing protein [Polyangia bacterium]
MKTLSVVLCVLACLAGARTAEALGGCPPTVYECYTEYDVCLDGGGPLQRKRPGSGLSSPQQLPICNDCEPDHNVNKANTIACSTDNNPCTADYCDGNGNCAHTATNENGACTDDGNACTNDVCQAGTCQHVANANPCTDDGNACTNDVCQAGSCQHVANANACTNDSNVCTTDVCSGGQCTHNNPTGGKVCGAQCIAQAACCQNSDCAGINNGSGVCSGPGGSCSVTCNGGYKQCGSQCIPSNACCTDSDCPGNTANHQHGVCGASACVFACDAGYKVCGATCIAQASCCASSDCVTPPSGCYKSAGTCTSGACSYAYNDGAACNADSDACTPNDTCKTGACVADSAHTVKCVQRDCHSAPACNKSTGNCDDSNVANGTACGGNGCTATVGSCSNGSCSSTPKDCSAQTTDCTLGACDAKAAVGAPCTTSNKPNGTACNLADKCLIGPACSGGACTGTKKACAPSGACRISECNSTSGDCEETVAPAGTSCSVPGACTQNATCDSNGNCNGDPVPDGAPCDDDACATATCVSGACSCVTSPDFGATPIDGGGETKPKDSKGCSAAPGSAGGTLPGFLLLAGAFLIVRRRRAR